VSDPYCEDCDVNGDGIGDREKVAIEQAAMLLGASAVIRIHYCISQAGALCARYVRPCGIIVSVKIKEHADASARRFASVSALMVVYPWLAYPIRSYKD
jgi:hypothetical protein